MGPIKRLICRFTDDHLFLALCYTVFIRKKEGFSMYGAILGDLIGAPYEFVNDK